MKVPLKAKVGSHDYELIVSQPLAEVADVSNGVCYANKTQIILHPAQAPSHMRVTLLHELLHAICDDVALGEYANAPAGATISNEVEELVVRKLATGILRLLRDNPKIVAFLLEP